MSEAGETETPSQNDPTSPTIGTKTAHDDANDADSGPHASKRSKTSALELDDQDSFNNACDRVAPLFTGSTFPSIPRSAIEGFSESAVSAACAHIVNTKGISFPFHRQFTSNDDVAAMLARYMVL
jgi:hypothetical protein